MFDCASSATDVIDVAGRELQARCTMMSAPPSCPAMLSSSRRASSSPGINPATRFSRSGLSRMVTAIPDSRNAVATADPRNPAPPVRTALMSDQFAGPHDYTLRRIPTL